MVQLQVLPDTILQQHNLWRHLCAQGLIGSIGLSSWCTAPSTPGYTRPSSHTTISAGKKGFRSNKSYKSRYLFKNSRFSFFTACSSLRTGVATRHLAGGFFRARRLSALPSWRPSWRSPPPSAWSLRSSCPGSRRAWACWPSACWPSASWPSACWPSACSACWPSTCWPRADLPTCGQLVTKYRQDNWQGTGLA